MKRIKLSEIAENLAPLFARTPNGVVYFDHKSYDDPNDIPTLAGEKVLEVSLGTDPSLLYVVTESTNGEKKVIDLNVETLTDEAYDDIYSLLSDTYYELPCSYAIGDFELEFLGFDMDAFELED